MKKLATVALCLLSAACAAESVAPRTSAQLTVITGINAPHVLVEPMIGVEIESIEVITSATREELRGSKSH